MTGPLNFYQNLGGDIMSYYGSTNEFDVFDVDYENSLENYISFGVSMRLDTKGAKTQVLNPLPGVVYLVVIGLKSTLKSGNRLAPIKQDGSTPCATVIQNTEMADCVAFRSNRNGTIEVSQRDTSQLYTNVWFDFVAATKPTEPEIAEFQESKRFETNRAVIYARQNVKKGMRLLDSETGRRYLILAVAGTGNHKLLQLQGDSR